MRGILRRGMSSPFVSLIFRGARFDAAAMPVEALPEISAYRELVLAVAREIWLAQNPARQRTPKGFEAGFMLRLTGVQPGSTVPVVERLAPAGQPRFVPKLAQARLFESVPDVFDEAREVVQRAISAANLGKALPKLSRGTFLRFNAFGRTLHEKDEIVVARAGEKEGPIYNRAVRKRLILEADSSYDEDTEIVGLFRAADLDTSGFTLRTLDGDKIRVTCPPLLVPVAVSSLQGAAEVRVRGTGSFNPEGKLLRIVSAVDVNLADEEDTKAAQCKVPIGEQLDALRMLEAGWFEGDGDAYDPAGLDWARALLEAVAEAFELPTPFVYPTPEGEIRVEWPARDWDVVVLVDTATKSASVVAASMKDEPVVEADFKLTAPGAESKLGAFVAEHVRAK